MHDAGRDEIAFGQKLVELFAAQLLARRVAERILVLLAQGLSPILDHLAERELAGAVADKSFVVLELDVVAVDVDRRQLGGAVRRQRGANRGFCRH